MAASVCKRRRLLCVMTQTPEKQENVYNLKKTVKNNKPWKWFLSKD